ncbi:MAG: hypothetical protein KBF42_03025 [Chitinophagales bacterium]|nr:hypothetical protein [Bacteroidota bacterium]MBK7568860.1 hypothetical protein [Bacteroidota bacterium]MBP8915407.1 hypothetical protein [Chitinophagales bacterium]MBP9220330.1 hypothetical protein [Chitinophagales bacterium]MBP9794612.1 hypothetical protein [Chitinophagales bacterium]
MHKIQDLFLLSLITLKPVSYDQEISSKMHFNSIRGVNKYGEAINKTITLALLR